jgi:hypothetical protein
LGDLPPHEKFITEETEWNPELRIMIMLFLNMVPKWKCGADNKKVNRNYHQSGVIIGPVIAHTDWERVGQL